MPSIGDKFNKFTIISQASAKSFMCQCVCGNMRKLYVSDMARESCGCLQTQQKKINVGDKFQTSLGGTVVVTKYTHANDITVVFENTGYERTTTSGNLQKGKVLDKSIKRINPEKAKDINFFWQRQQKSTEVCIITPKQHMLQVISL